MLLRDYQIEIAERASKVLDELHIVYLAMEMRVGKTLTSFKTAEIRNYKNVIFITKKLAISSIEKDYLDYCQQYGSNFKLTVINYEQAVKQIPIYDLIIVDEAHSMGAYPKPAQRTQAIARLIGNNDLIMLSGTPSPETKTQLFHQFWVSNHNPFRESNFYKWAKVYVDVEKKERNGFMTNDYKKAKDDLIMKVVDKYFISYSQVDAGFVQSEVNEVVVEVEPDPRIKTLCTILKRDRLYEFKDGSRIICDQAVKLQNKIHQVCSGTVITESEETTIDKDTGEMITTFDNKDIKIIDYSKADYILNNYQGKRIAVFYKFIAEGLAIKSRLKDWTDNPMQFDSGKYPVFISQIQSGAMGINLSKADVLIFYNIDFSATLYWQARARIQSFDRENQPVVHWLFTPDGIERKIYRRVLDKKAYTLKYFIRDYYPSQKAFDAEEEVFDNLFGELYGTRPSNKSNRETEADGMLCDKVVTGFEKRSA